MSIPLSKPDIGEREIELVTQVLRSGRLSLGPCLEEFEERFAAYIGRRYAVAASSGTAALHMCAKALGIGDADEVLTTSFTFVASANCLLYERALPSFVDVDPATMNVDAAAIRRALERDYVLEMPSKRVVNRMSGRVLKAILPVHVFGLPCEMKEIESIAREWGLHIIEDACEALGAQFDGRLAGSFGDAAAFAFYPNKQITTGEGGMVVTDDPQIATACRALRNQGRAESDSWLRHDHLGYNYRLSELHCALGIAQMERVAELLAARARSAALYERSLKHFQQLALPRTPENTVRSWFAYVVQLKGANGASLRDQLVAGLRARGIACQTYFPPVHRQPYLKHLILLPERPLPETESAAARCVALPFFPSMSEQQVAKVCGAIGEILSECEEREPTAAHALAFTASGGAA